MLHHMLHICSHTTLNHQPQQSPYDNDDVSDDVESAHYRQNNNRPGHILYSVSYYRM